MYYQQIQESDSQKNLLPKSYGMDRLDLETEIEQSREHSLTGQ